MPTMLCRTVAAQQVGGDHRVAHREILTIREKVQPREGQVRLLVRPVHLDHLPELADRPLEVTAEPCELALGEEPVRGRSRRWGGWRTKLVWPVKPKSPR